MERKKRSKGSVWEFCYANKIFGAFGFKIKACGQKLVTFCAHTRGEISSRDIVIFSINFVYLKIMRRHTPVFWHDEVEILEMVAFHGNCKK